MKDNINLNKEIMLTLVVESNSILDSTTSKELIEEQKLIKCFTYKSLKHILAISGINYSKRHN